MANRSTMLMLVASWLLGCGLQVSGAARGRRPADLGFATELRGRLSGVRSTDGLYAGWGAAFADPEGPHGYRMRHLSVDTGYRRRAFSFLRWEAGGRLGMGEPVAVAYQQMGIYLGLEGALLFRVPGLGGHDNRRGAAPIGYSVDVALTAEGGYWARAAASADVSRPEMSIGAGLRLTLFSDLLVAADDSWEAAP